MCTNVYNMFLITHNFRLKQQLQEGPTHGPYQAYMKFSDIHGRLQEKFTDTKITQQATSRVIEWAFPSARSERTTHVYGVRCRPIAEASMLPGPSQGSVRHTLNPIPDLQVQNSQLQQRLSLLEAENRELKRSLESSMTIATLDSQLQKLVHPGSLIFHGPENLEWFEQFSLDAVMAEVRSLAPDLLRLFNTLGETRRNTTDAVNGLSTEEIKVLVSISTLANSRSRKAKGLQLSTMLIARGTSKQVRSITM